MSRGFHCMAGLCGGFCFECSSERELEKVELKEKVTIKGDTFENTHYCVKCVSCGEL